MLLFGVVLVLVMAFLHFHFRMNLFMVLKRCRCRRIIPITNKTSKPFSSTSTSSTFIPKSLSRLYMSTQCQCQHLHQPTNFSSNSSSKSFSLNTFVLVCLLVCGANSQASFSKVGSDTCGSVSGRGDIMDKATCDEAARSLGLSETTADEGKFTDAPPGCFYDSFSDGTDYLMYNSDSSSTISCSFSDPEYPSVTSCLCLSAPKCTHTNGTTVNTDACLCGGTGCTAASGLYCDSSLGACGTAPITTCANTDGSSANSVTCMCGNVVCTPSISYCTNSSSICEPYKPCLITDGSTSNSADCSCNGTMCTGQRLICDIEEVDLSLVCKKGECGANAMTTNSTPNCKRFTPRCQCVLCKPTFYSSDCSKKCPAPAISITVDSLFILFGGWVFLAYLYYTHRQASSMDEAKQAEETAKKSKETGGESTQHHSKAAKTSAAKQMKLKIRTLQRILISRLQIIAAILASILWSPQVPNFLIDTLRFIADIFTINVPGLLTSVDCLGGGGGGEGMDPMTKWYLQLFFPFGLLVVLFIWYRCLAPKSIAKSTVKEASIQVGFVWLFESIVVTSFKPLDCTGSESNSFFTGGMSGKLIMDPTLPCPLGSEGNPGVAVLGIFVLLAYVVVPYCWFFQQARVFRSCCVRSAADKTSILQSQSGATLTTAFGWALESYKQEIKGFEIWNVISRTVIIAGSTIMYPENRFVVHILFMSLSLWLHIQFRPYIDQESNVCAILFCICDILGAITAVEASDDLIFNFDFPSAGLQMVFISVTFITIVVVGVGAMRGIRAQTTESQTKLLSKTTNDLFASYTPLEKKLLFPVLAIVWLLVKFLQKINKKKGNTKITPLTKNQEDSSVMPTEEEPKEEEEEGKEVEKVEEEKEVQEKESELDSGNKTYISTNSTTAVQL